MAPTRKMDLHQLIGEKDPRKFERISANIFQQSEQGSLYVAKQIAEYIRAQQLKGELAVLGLATGSSPVKVYDLLVRFHREEALSFHNVVTFNLDEYYPMDPAALQSYRRFMDEHLFHHVDIDPARIYI
ncbi:MAG: 6-phosphogluconolactonase, partial [Lewinella sp.]|nr:6-phosphogluconolactonase [Lewinella sp.]